MLNTLKHCVSLNVGELRSQNFFLVPARHLFNKLILNVVFALASNYNLLPSSRTHEPIQVPYTLFVSLAVGFNSTVPPASASIF